MTKPLTQALAELDAARLDAPSPALEKRIGEAAWAHYYERLDRATAALEAAARALVESQP